MASLVAILDLKGKSLIQRSYRDDVPPTYVDKFLPHLFEMEEEGQRRKKESEWVRQIEELKLRIGIIFEGSPFYIHTEDRGELVSELYRGWV